MRASAPRTGGSTLDRTGHNSIPSPTGPPEARNQKAFVALVQQKVYGFLVSGGSWVVNSDINKIINIRNFYPRTSPEIQITIRLSC